VELTVVGSGTAVPSPQHVGACLYVDAPPVHMLLDCGPGATHHMARHGVPWQRITHLALTHFHNDHIGDVPALLFALKHGLRERRQAPLNVIGPPGVAALLDRLADAFGDHVRDPGFPLHVLELAGSERMGALTLHGVSTPHTHASLGYRLATAGATLGYTGDTGPSDEVAMFFAGVDLLVAECSLPDAEAMPTHLTPTGVARLAAAARPGALVVTHVYPQLDRERLPQLIAGAGWRGPVHVARDGLRLPVAAD
jgi:ribonuclease BN (tRNA processing enzyme)